jgi:hypothetical protein
MMLPLKRNPYSTYYRSTFAFSAFLYPHFQQRSLRFACPLRAKIRAYHVSLKQQERVRPCLFTGSVECPRALIQKENNPLRRLFGSSLSASLACTHVTMFISSSLALVIPSSLAPHPFLMLADVNIPSRFNSGYSAELHCHGSFTHTRYQLCMCH